MDNFTLAVKGHLPIIGVHSDDPVNFRSVLGVLSGKKVSPLPTKHTLAVDEGTLYVIPELEAVTPEWYRKLSEAGTSAVILNPAKSNSLVFDAGELFTPEIFYTTYLEDFVEEPAIPGLVKALRGLSPKTSQEVVQLTMARCHSVTPHSVRQTRLMLVGSTPGLQNLDTTYDFYETPKTLSTWLEINKKYFLQESGMERLVPRGLLLAGPPGVGKSMAASVIAHDWDLPLFRLDVGATMNRWLGETEGRVYRSLSLVDANSPCVLLVDEVEKLFSTTEDGGTTQRVLSQLLWWLQFRRSRVLVVMTTNNLKSIPQELYRPGRIDKVITLELLTAAQATKFSVRVLESVTGKPATTKQLDVIKDTFWISAEHYSHAQVTEMVYDMVKNNKWVG